MAGWPSISNSPYLNELIGMTMQTILIVEDEEKLASLLADYFKQSGFHTHCIHNGLEVISWLQNNSADAVMLDLMLPGKDGMQLCKEIRQFSQLPILMVTARVEEIDRLLGLEIGADDYICKPFSPREVVARAKAVLRRVSPNQTNNNASLVLDDNRLRVSIAERSLELTSVEFHLLKLLASEPGRIFSREQMMRASYDDHRIVSDRTIDSHIKKLRKRLEGIDASELIHSVYGVGYKLEPLNV
jgi:two-component system response regulator BaeR